MRWTGRPSAGGAGAAGVSAGREGDTAGTCTALYSVLHFTDTVQEEAERLTVELAARTTAVKQAEQQAEEAGRLATRTEQEAAGLRVEVVCRVEGG